MTESKTLTATQVAEKLGTDGRTFRRFYRSVIRANGGAVGTDTPGKGKRYAFDAKDVKDLKVRFAEWDSSRKAAKSDDAEPEEDAAE